MAVKQNVSFTITAKPGPMTLTVNDVPFTITSQGTNWVAARDVAFSTCTVSIKMQINGVATEPYDMTITINGTDQEIKGTLKDDDLNKVTVLFPLTKFNLPCP